MESAAGVWQRWVNYSLRHGRHLSSYDLFKIVALIAMIIDHIGFYLMPDENGMRVIGRIAFPIFLFLVGYSRQWRFDRWLLVAATAITLTSWATHHPIFPLNILVTILLCRVVLYWGVPRGYFAKPDIFLFIALLVWLIPMTILCDYGAFAMMYALIGYWKRESEWNRSHDLFLAATLLLHGIWSIFAVETQTLGTLGIILIMLGLGNAFRNFRLYTVALPPQVQLSEITAVFIARNSLFIYAAHLMAFMVLARCFT